MYSVPREKVVCFNFTWGYYIRRKMWKIVIFTIFFAIASIKASGSDELVEFSCEDDAATECAPYFSQFMDSEVKPRINGPYTFMCTVGGKPRPNVTWMKSGEDKYVTEAERKINSIQLSDNGNYTCQACNKLGCINHTMKIDVDYGKLEFLKSLQNSTAMIGKPFQFECLTNKHASNTVVYWYPHTADRIAPDTGVASPLELRSDKEYSGIYKINNVTKEDEGWYRCATSNPDKAEDVIDSHAFLTVNSGDAPSGSNFMITTSGFLAAFLLACAFCLCYQRFKKNDSDVFDLESLQKYSYIRKVVIQERLNSEEKFLIFIDRQLISPGNDDNESGNKYEVNYEIPRDNNWDVPRKNVQLGEKIGEGAFGIVYKATAELQPNTITTVAVKTLRDNLDDDNGLLDLVSEMQMMKVIGKHKNIINLVGQSTDEKLMVLMEYAAFGNLQKFLVNHQYSDRNISNEYSIMGNTLQESTLLGFARQIAEAMEFLAFKKCIHRDLAARNVLVTENLVMKVADFGLSRYTRDKDYYHKVDPYGRVPFKWMAPESLYRQHYTSQSDVWSFGIVLWEIMTMGSAPYGTMSNQQVYDEVRIGLRLDRPELCSIRTYCLMQKCWSYEPQERPDFSSILNELDDIINNLDDIGTVSTQSINEYVGQSSCSESEEEFGVDSSLYNAPLVTVH